MRMKRMLLAMALLLPLLLAAVPGRAAQCGGCACDTNDMFCACSPCGSCGAITGCKKPCKCEAGTKPLWRLPVYPVPEAPATGAASMAGGALLLSALGAAAICCGTMRKRKY